jgi:4-hydroxy-tetrahydrodipicolinate synthase
MVTERARGRCPVLAHTGQHSAAETIELTRHAESAGADFAVVINPYYPPASDEGLYAWFAHVCRCVDIGVWLFDTSYSGVTLSTGLIERLAGIENVVGIKVGRDHTRYLELLGRFGDQILVCSPHEETWLENMISHGQRVYMSSAAPYLYQVPDWQPMREYTTLALAGETARAAQVAATLDPVRAVAAKWLQGHARRIDSIASIKAWAGLAGMSGGPVRPPLVSLTAAERDALAADLAAVGLC